MANLNLFAKCGLALLIVVSTAILIERLTDVKHYWIEDLDNDQVINDTNWPDVDPIAVEETVFSVMFSECLTQHSKSHYYPIHQIRSVCIPHSTCIEDFLIDLSKIMETLDVNLLLLEPSLLFCMLPKSRKFNLMTRGFNPNKMQKSRNVVTFGIRQSDVEKLEMVNATMKLIFSGYGIQRFDTWMNSSYWNKGELEKDVKNSHYFITHQDMMMHLIVLRSRGSYIWSGGLKNSEVRLNGLQYINDTAFENFTTSLVHWKTSSTKTPRTQIFLPFDTRCFLLDTMTSNYVECKAVPSHKKISNVPIKEEIAVKELKKILASQMITFWLWSKTLQGWFEKCDILHYSEELKFSVAAKSVNGYNFTGLFSSKECQYVESDFNLDSSIKNIKLNCHGVPIDLIFIYEDKASYWYEYDDGQNFYRITFPKFSLCSTDVFGQKISIPCETRKIFEEYGQYLKNTTLVLDSASTNNVLLIDTS